MRHLKKYNESKEELTLQDIRDICLELQDEGFKIEIEYYYVKISNPNKKFKYDEVKDVMLRLKDYLGEWYLRTVVNGGTYSYACSFNETSLMTHFHTDMTNCLLNTVVITHGYNFKNKK